jgi:4-methyl-5(b-hydroxyethyl)-thiazole monophosphate biosynthesis
METLMAKVLIPIADGTEEMEAVIVIDVLRRAKIDVCVASVMPNRKEISASRGVRILADTLLSECLDHTWDMIVLPGGMPGASHLHDSTPLLQLLQDQVAGGRWLAAICAAPAVVLGRHGLIPQSTATCYPAYQKELAEQIGAVNQERVVVDGKLITSQGPGTATEFALQLVEALSGKQASAEVAKEMVVAQPMTLAG